MTVAAMTVAAVVSRPTAAVLMADLHCRPAGGSVYSAVSRPALRMSGAIRAVGKLL